MKANIILTTLSTILVLSITLDSCKKDSTSEQTNTNTEFIADNSTFSDFMSWPLQAEKNGADPSLGMAHAGNDSTANRKVHFKSGVNPVNGVYPVGSVIVKHTTNKAGTLNELTAMVKRGNNFNPSKGNWEFFMLKPDGSIAQDSTGMSMRGANLMNGMCGSCHAGASAKDFIFSK